MSNSVRFNFLLIALGVVSTSATAQTRIQCHLNEQGRATAALIWQNTLGVERANAICRDSISQVQAPIAAQSQAPQATPRTPENHAVLAGRDAPMVQRQQSTSAQPANMQPQARPVIQLPQVVHERFEKDVYARALVARDAPQGSGSQHSAQLPGPGAAPNGDYVPLEQSGMGGGEADNGSYIAIW